MYWTKTLDHVWYTAGEEGGREGREGGRQGGRGRLREGGRQGGRGRLREGGRKGEGEMVRGRGRERKRERGVEGRIKRLLHTHVVILFTLFFSAGIGRSGTFCLVDACLKRVS